MISVFVRSSWCFTIHDAYISYHAVHIMPVIRFVDEPTHVEQTAKAPSICSRHHTFQELGDGTRGELDAS